MAVSALSDLALLPFFRSFTETSRSVLMKLYGMAFQGSSCAEKQGSLLLGTLSMNSIASRMVDTNDH
eukprot:751898-Amphidinium_carterae.2